MFPSYVGTIIDSIIARRCQRKDGEEWNTEQDFLWDVAWEINDVLERKRQNPAEPEYEAEVIINGKYLFKKN